MNCFKSLAWGGEGDGEPPRYVNTGGIYDPATDTWTATSTSNAPSARQSEAAVWTGSRMIVWGGGDPSGLVNTGGAYSDPGRASTSATPGQPRPAT